MDGGGAFTGGDGPEDPEGHFEDAAFGAPGWLPPEDRLWRHPSEIARHGLPGPAFSAFGVEAEQGARRRMGRSSLAAGAAGVAAMAAAVAITLIVVDATGSTPEHGANPATSSGSNSATIETSGLTIPSDVTQIVSSLRPSLVAIEPTSGAHDHMTGVVLPGGGLVVTAASAAASVTQVDLITSNGKRHRGRVVGSDPHSGVAVVSTDGGLVPADFADEPVGPGDFALVACLCASDPSTGGRHHRAPNAAMSKVAQVGQGVAPQGGPMLVDAIEAEMPLGHSPWGGVLVDSDGSVIGILDGVTPGRGSASLGVFVPAPLAVGVGEELAASHHVHHGWLGVVCSDAGPSGATVIRVMPGSPAAGVGLKPGDVVEEVGPHQVGSLAELQERLYTVPPGQAVQLSVARGAQRIPMSVTLAESPGT